MLMAKENAREGFALCSPLGAVGVQVLLDASWTDPDHCLLDSVSGLPAWLSIWIVKGTWRLPPPCRRRGGPGDSELAHSPCSRSLSRRPSPGYFRHGSAGAVAELTSPSRADRCIWMRRPLKRGPMARERPRFLRSTRTGREQKLSQDSAARASSSISSSAP